MEDFLNLGGRKIKNRLILGSGKFPSDEIFEKIIKECEIEAVTVALRRVDIFSKRRDILDVIPKNVIVMVNTSGAKTAEEAIKIAEISRKSGVSDFIKIEIIPDKKYFLPDPIETYKACDFLVKEGFKVFPYVNADPVLCKKLEMLGVSAVMPLGSPIGSGLGLKNKYNIELIVKECNCPVIVDAGIGKVGDAVECIELGADAVMINTAISSAENPLNMAKAFKKGIESARLSYLSGLINSKNYASPSSPLENLLFEDFLEE
jgi:thiazole synthase